MRDALRVTERLAQHDVPVLIEGETGTGKTGLALHVHRCSPRASHALVTKALTEVEDTLAASDLFGHIVGAFTDARHTRPGMFASADGGTLFLDEIGKASLTVQNKLLRVIETGEIYPLGCDRMVRVDVRLVTATNVALEQLVESGGFLPDLAQRVAKFRVRLPPLRERLEDLPALVEDIVAMRAERFGFLAGPPRVDDDLMAAFVSAPWPGNLRELDHVIQRLLIDAEGAEVLTPSLCTGDLAYLHPSRQAPRRGRALSRAEVECARQRNGGNVTAAAREPGVSRQAIYDALRRQPKEGAASQPPPPPAA